MTHLKRTAFKRIAFPLLLTLTAPLPAFAHIGHVIEVAGGGHDHWIAIAALGAGAAVAVAGLLKEKGEKTKAEGKADPADADTEIDGDTAEQPA